MSIATSYSANMLVTLAMDINADDRDYKPLSLATKYSGDNKRSIIIHIDNLKLQQEQFSIICPISPYSTIVSFREIFDSDNSNSFTYNLSVFGLNENNQRSQEEFGDYDLLGNILVGNVENNRDGNTVLSFYTFDDEKTLYSIAEDVLGDDEKKQAVFDRHKKDSDWYLGILCTAAQEQAANVSLLIDYIAGTPSTVDISKIS